MNISVQSNITRVVGQNYLNCAGMCASMSSLGGHVMRGFSCCLRNLIQVTQIRETVAIVILNLCAKSCSSKLKRSRTSVRKSSSIGCQ